MGMQFQDWVPTQEQIEQTHLYALMSEKGFTSYEEAQRWSAGNPDFWEYTINKLGVQFQKPYSQLLDMSHGLAHAQWLVGAEMNIAESCLSGQRDRPAIVTRRRNGQIETLTMEDLDRLSNRVANGLQTQGILKGDAVAIDMPLTVEAVGIYLGVIKSGAVVVSIADSFAPPEIVKRLDIGEVKLVFTQDEPAIEDKTLYGNLCEAHAPRMIVLDGKLKSELREDDLRWDHFLSNDTEFKPVACSSQDAINYIFSSGTTGDPKCIPWNHGTPIKCASDGMYHQDIRAGDVVCWHTNLGWMMGPWLVFASLMNKAAIAIYEGSPSERGFCQFVQDAKVTMLGLVPRIAINWHNKGIAKGFDWSSLRCFSSSGEASNPAVYAWLMGLNQPKGVRKPVIEYCGGTEQAGGQFACNLITACGPSEFNGMVMGTGSIIVDENFKPCSVGQIGEAYVVGPAIGLSTALKNFDNEEKYYRDPEWLSRGLRVHGDLYEIQADGRYRHIGRADDCMNLNGIKVGCVDIERPVNNAANVLETAAIGVPEPGGGPDRLIIYATMKDGTDPEKVDTLALKREMQKIIRREVNKDFRLNEVVVVDQLPRNSSGKVERRQLRKLYLASEADPSRPAGNFHKAQVPAPMAGSGQSST